MATQNSSVDAPLSPLQLAQAAADQVYAAYDLALEMEVLLAAINEPNDAPKWAFPLHRMVERITMAADLGHTAVIRVRGAIEGGAA